MALKSCVSELAACNDYVQPECTECKAKDAAPVFVYSPIVLAHASISEISGRLAPATGKHEGRGTEERRTAPRTEVTDGTARKVFVSRVGTLRDSTM